uniref:SLC26A/SulP transporter domain-containing protein n=1 Tax=Aegilops tauschii subsp. strangulata TaxID=200361 RepID=A0A453QLY3_AEGTS
QRLAEIFFPDDPLHQFKNQSLARKLVLALQYFFPIFHWGSNYSLRLLRSDAVAGLTIASLAIPQVIIPSIDFSACRQAGASAPSIRRPIFRTFLFWSMAR